MLGDPGFPARVRAAGLTSVTLAATYHATRAATPHHPARRLVDAAHSALYRPAPDPAAPRWAGARLRPATPAWTGPEPDPFGAAARLLRAEGLAVTAWLVLGHDSRLGTAHPDLTVVNCYGEHYRYALCPSHAEVRAYGAALAAEALDGVPVDGVSLEGCGQLGVVHAGTHEKTDGAWTAEQARLLSVCCCAACAAAWSARGLNPGSVRAALRTAVRSGLPLSDEFAATLLAV
ncbi:alanine-rich protein, partial [Streptomyces sp. SPB074]